MRIAVRQMPSGGKKLLTVFCVGVLAGFFIMNIGKSILLENTGLFDEDTLYRLKYMSVDGSALFCYIFRKRMMVLILMAVLSTTYLGYVVCVGVTGWYGMSSGVFLSALTVRYGIKGLVLAIVSAFPQYVFYIPAVIMMLGWSESLYHAIYSGGTGTNAADRTFVIKKLGWLGMIAGLVLLGCLMEGYVNPGILMGYLKVF